MTTLHFTAMTQESLIYRLFQGQKLLGQVNLKECYVLLTDENIVTKPNCLHILYPKGRLMRSIYVCANSVRVSFSVTRDFRGDFFKDVCKSGQENKQIRTAGKGF